MCNYANYQSLYLGSVRHTSSRSFTNIHTLPISQAVTTTHERRRRHRRLCLFSVRATGTAATPCCVSCTNTIHTCPHLPGLGPHSCTYVCSGLTCPPRMYVRRDLSIPIYVRRRTTWVGVPEHEVLLQHRSSAAPEKSRGLSDDVSLV